MGDLDPRFYEGLAEELVGRLHRVSLFTPHRHASGYYHEEILRDTIRALVSPRFQVRTGFAYSSREVVSRQGDILIVDETDPAPYHFRQGDFVIANPRALAAVVEVKTVLNKRDFLDAAENIRSFKAVVQAARPSRSFLAGFVFSFDSPVLSPGNLDGWYRACSVPDDMRWYPNAVIALKKGMLWLILERQTGHFGHHFVLGEERKRVRPKTLSMFLATVIKHVELFAGVESNPFEFADLSGLASSRSFYRYGSGHIESVEAGGAAVGPCNTASGPTTSKTPTVGPRPD